MQWRIGFDRVADSTGGCFCLGICWLLFSSSSLSQDFLLFAFLVCAWERRVCCVCAGIISNRWSAALATISWLPDNDDYDETMQMKRTPSKRVHTIYFHKLILSVQISVALSPIPCCTYPLPLSLQKIYYIFFIYHFLRDSKHQPPPLSVRNAVQSKCRWADNMRPYAKLRFTMHSIHSSIRLKFKSILSVILWFYEYRGFSSLLGVMSVSNA